jgi:hypothetical protein
MIFARHRQDNCSALLTNKGPETGKENGDPNGIRTRVTAVKGRCPGPLDDRVEKAGQYQKSPDSPQGKFRRDYDRNSRQ